MTVARPAPLHVLLLVHNLGIGGAQVAVCNLATALVEVNCMPIVCAWKRTGILAQRLQSTSVAVEVPPHEPTGWRRLGVPFALQQVMRRHRIDVIHAHMSDSAAWGTLLQTISGRPCVITHHSNNLTDNTAPMQSWQAAGRRWLLCLTARQATTNIAVSGAIRDRLFREAGVPRERVELVPNAVPPAPIEGVVRAAAQRQTRAARRFEEHGRPRVVYVGRLAAGKRHDILLAAWPLVIRALPTATLVLVGEGPLEAELRVQAEQHGIASRVSFAGATVSADDWLADADLYVSASTSEGLSIALLEAMAWGVPVVVSDVPGHHELVRAGETGRLVPAASPALIAEAIIAALTHWNESAACAARAQQMVDTHYSLAAAARRHVEIYHATLSGRVRP